MERFSGSKVCIHCTVNNLVISIYSRLRRPVDIPPPNLPLWASNPSPSTPNVDQSQVGESLPEIKKQEEKTLVCVHVYSSSRVIYSLANPSWTIFTHTRKDPTKKGEEKSRRTHNTAAWTQLHLTTVSVTWASRRLGSLRLPANNRRLTHPAAQKVIFFLLFFVKHVNVKKFIESPRQLRILLQFICSPECLTAAQKSKAGRAGG